MPPLHPHRPLKAALAVLGLCLALPLGSAAAQQPIRWRTGNAPVARAQARPVEAVLEQVARRQGTSHVVVQLDGPLTAHTRARLEAAGVRPLRSLGSHAFFASVSNESLDPRAAASVADLSAVSAIRPAWKMHPEVLAGRHPQWAVVEGADSLDPRVAVYALFHPDVPLEDAVRVAREKGATVRDRLESLNGLVLELPSSRVRDLAVADETMWVEPPLPRMSDTAWNDSNRPLVQADLVQAGPYNLDGSGVTVLVYDGGTARATHDDFGGRATVRDGAGLSFHATHVAGTIGGDGTASGGTWRGMAPGVTIESYGFEFDGTGVFLYTNPGDIESDYDAAINTFGADISNNSIGTNTEPNGFPCNFQGDYGVTAALIDAIVGGSLGAPFRIVWANGNERGGSRCDIEGFGDYYSTAPPATAKNHITVGALNSNNDTMTSFSSWGPTDDGRLKPDVSAPGCQAGGDGGVTSPDSANDTAYTTLCGTSMASPTTCGCCALMLEDYRAQFGGADPRNSTLKALLAQTAADNGNTGPDYQFGYGSIRVKDAIDFMRLGQFDEETIDDQGESYLYSVTVGGGDPELKLTLAWDDAPATPNVFGSLVNDLDLRVTDPLGAQHFPWNLDPANPGAAATQVQADHVNNIEQVCVTSPLAGTWTVEIVGFDVPEGPQVYSLTSSHALTSGPFVQIGYVSTLPDRIAPGATTAVICEIVGVGDTVVGGSPTLHFRYDGGGFLSVPMGSLGGDQYTAELPPPVCGATPEFYVSAAGASSGTTTSPGDAPTTVLGATVEEITTDFEDDFQTDKGWTVVNVSVTDGAWERGVPAGDGGRSDPLVDFDGSGQCFLTDNVTGNSDLDGGPSRLVSPTIDLSSASDPTVSYARWFANDDFDVDSMVVEISDSGSGGPWTTVETVTGDTSGWSTHSFRVLDFVGLTNQVVVRINVTDNPNDSVTEAAFDAFLIESSACTASLADCNGNNIVDSDDISSGRSTDTNSNSVPDECENSGGSHWYTPPVKRP